MNGTFTSLAVVDGKPAISYFEAATGDLKYVRATDTGGTVWDAPVILDALATTQFTALAVVDGKPAVIYTASNSLKFLRATDASGTAWGAPVSIGSLSGPGQYASLAVVDGKPAISYVSNLPHFLKYVRAIDAEGAAWGTPLIINPGGPAGHYCSLKVINGNPAISCYEAINGDLRFLRATDAEGTTWGTAVVIDSTDDVGQFMSLAVIDGRPAISYHDATHSDLKYVQATDADGTAWGTPVTLDSVGNVGQHTSLALVDGAPAISYYDATNGDLKFIAISEPQLRWQASDGSVAPLTAATVTAGAIGSDQLAAGAVGTTQLAAGAVQTANIASGVIGSEQLATNAVQSGNIASGAVGSEQLAANAVQSSNISAGAVGTSQLADLAITDDKLRLGTEIGTIDDGALTAATGMFNFNATFDYPFTSPPTVNLLTPGWTLGPVTATGFSASRASVPPVPLTLDSMGSVGAVGQATSLAVVDGYPAVSYYDATNGDLKYLRATDASGSSWGVPVTVDTGGPGTVDVGVYTSLTVVDGCPAISYFDSTNDDLKYVRALDPAGNTWAAPLTLDSGGDVGSYTSLVVVDGFPAVCYYDNTNGDLKYLRATDAAGATWGTPVAFPDGGNFVGRCCSMTIVNGFPAISYQDSSVQQLKYVRASDATGTTWGTPTTISSTGTVSSFTSLAVVNGFPAISYRQGTSVSMLRFVRATDATGTAWGTPLALDNSNGKETCLKVIASIPTIIYQYGNPGGLKYVCATNASGTTWNTPFMLSGSASGSRHPSLAEVSGKAAISYHDSTSGDLKFVLLTADLRWQASDGSIAPLTAAGVAAGAIGSEQLATGAVQSANIAAGAIGSDQLAANAVQSGNIASGAIGSTQLAANAVLGSNIADGAVSSEQLAANAVQSANIAAGAVGTDQMADFAITSSKLRPGYVSGTLADGMTDVAPGVLAFSASFACPFDVAPAVNLLTPGWALGPISSSGFSATLTYQPQVIQQFFASLPPSPGRYTSLAVLTVGIPAVSYFDVSRTLKYVHAFNPRGTEWLPTAAITIDGTSNAGQYSSLAVVGGNPAIAYYAATTGDLKFVRSIDPMGTMSTMWDPPVTLDSADNVGQYVSLAEVDGNPAISYYDATNTSLKYIRAADSMGMSWETPLTLDSPDSSDSAGAHSSLAVINGNPAISYHDATNGDLKYIRATDATGSNWGPPLTVDTGDTANVGTFTSLIVVDGNPAISYYDGTNGDLKFVRATDANGTAWGTPVTPDSTGSVGTYCSLQVVYGRPAISYYDATISALKYVQASDASGTAWGAPLILDNTGMTGFHTSLAVVDGVPAVSYYEQYPAPAKYKFAVVPYDSAPELAWQASDGSVAPIIAATVASGAIGSTQLAANAVQTGNIASGAVGSAQLAPNLTISGTLSATAITGDGSGLTNIPASAVVTAPPGMVLIPAGAFTMGNTVAADTDITDASPVTVTLSAFYMAIHEVTLSQWQAVYLWATSNGYSFTNAGAGKSVNHPVHTVNWHDVVKWCNARSEMEGLTPCYTLSGATYKTGEDSVVVCNWSANGYRLPTEAEWEKAARGGLAGQRFPWGDTITQNLANYRGNTLISYDLGPDGYHPLGNDGTMPYTTPVGTFAANGYGLHDITGNIWEWCWDWYGTPYAGGGEPHGPTSGTDRVHRGGSWFSNTRCRTAYRDYSIPGNSYHHVGFRVTRKAVP
jgi:formylglycine-generating enzyme required for sulfatase activity